MKFDVTVCFEFKGLEAESEAAAQQLADETVGVVKVEHPSTNEDIFSDVEAWECDV